MAGVTIHFLLVYSYGKQELIEQREFTDSKKATDAYAETERRYRRESANFEIVLIGADSLDTIMKTHGHYFRTSSDSLFSEFLSEPLTS